jgi:hypothetical protein
MSYLPFGTPHRAPVPAIPLPAPRTYIAPAPAPAPGPSTQAGYAGSQGAPSAGPRLPTSSEGSVGYRRGGKKTRKTLKKKRSTRRRSKRGGVKAPMATREGHVLVDLYILLSRTPTEASLRRVMAEFSDLTDPKYRGELVREANNIRTKLAAGDLSETEIANEVKEFLSERHLTNEEKELIRRQGVAVSAENMWMA